MSLTYCSSLVAIFKGSVSPLSSTITGAFMLKRIVSARATTANVAQPTLFAKLERPEPLPFHTWSYTWSLSAARKAEPELRTVSVLANVVPFALCLPLDPAALQQLQHCPNDDQDLYCCHRCRPTFHNLDIACFVLSSVAVHMVNVHIKVIVSHDRVLVKLNERNVWMTSYAGAGRI